MVRTRTALCASHRLRMAVSAAAGALWCLGSMAATPGETVVLGPFTGHDAKLHPENLRPAPVPYHGTDLGWTYLHDGTIHFLFGDTHADETGVSIDPKHDDVFGMIELADWPDPSKITPDNLPLLELLEKPDENKLVGMNPSGHPMEGLKTPVGGFSNGTREYGLFITAKPRACTNDADCPSHLTCDTNLGYIGEPPSRDEGLTLTCAKSWPGCITGSVNDFAQWSQSQGGFCSDRTSSMWSNTDYGRVSAVAMNHIIGIRGANASERGLYSDTKRWLTNKFINVAVRTVERFEPGGAAPDYRTASGAGGAQRVFMWGRPHFVGVNAKGNTLGMYFAYVDMPKGPEYSWDVNYFTGVDAKGVPQFSKNEKEAVALDLDASKPGVQPKEVHDIVQHMSIVWIDQLEQWVMFYGGGVSNVPYKGIAPRCGVLEIFARTECESVEMGNGALRMRTADHPWGPWSPPQDLIVGGDPDARPTQHQFASGGVLHHPACTGPDCETRSPEMAEGDYGWFYGANIIEEWTRPAGKGVDVIWLASTWNPYRVVLLKTRIEP